MGAIFSAHFFGRKELFLLSLCQCPPSRLRVTRLSREGQAVSGGRHREPSILGTARPGCSPLGEAKKQSLPQVSVEKVKGIGRVPQSGSTCTLNQQQDDFFSFIDYQLPPHTLWGGEAGLLL